MHNQKCFLLSYFKYGDNDAILHCFSKDHGFESFFARGIYSAKNKKKPYLIPLNFLQISKNTGSKTGKIPSISKIELAETTTENGNLFQNSILFFIAEFLNQVLREESKNDILFNEIEKFRSETFNGNHNAYTTFLVRFLQISGIAPLVNEHSFLNPEKGTFEGTKFHDLFDEELSQNWKDYLSTENPYEIHLKKVQRNQFTDSLMRYYQIHFTGFQIPKSLDILRQIYE